MSSGKGKTAADEEKDADDVVCRREYGRAEGACGRCRRADAGRSGGLFRRGACCLLLFLPLFHTQVAAGNLERVFKR